MSQDCVLLEENSGLRQFTKCSGKNIFKVRISQGILSLGILKTSQGKIDKYQKYSKTSKAGKKKIRVFFLCKRHFPLMKKAKAVEN